MVKLDIVYRPGVGLIGSAKQKAKAGGKKNGKKPKRDAGVGDKPDGDYSSPISNIVDGGADGAVPVAVSRPGDDVSELRTEHNLEGGDLAGSELTGCGNSAAEILAHKRALKAAQMKRYRSRVKWRGQ